MRLFEGVEVEGLKFNQFLEMDGRSYTQESAEARVEEIEKGEAEKEGKA